MIPRVSTPLRRHDRARPAARVPPAVLLTRRARVPARRLRLVDPEEPARRHDLGARGARGARALRRAGRPTYDRSISGSTTRSSARRRDARALPRLPRTRLAAQEPRAPLRGVRRAPASATPTSSSCSPRTTARRRPACARSATSRATSSSVSTGPPRVSSSRACYEGFGQPPLEAMACGCPVASSNAAALPEVCGDGARLFDPTSVEAMVDAVEEILARPDEWSARGSARAAGFSWEETARAHDAAYAAAVA